MTTPTTNTSSNLAYTEGRVWLSIVTNVLRFVLAAVFILSGFVKAVDPMGTVYKMEDYVEAFGMAGILPQGMFILFSILLCLFEFLCGICLLFAIWRRVTLTAIVAFLSVMTPLTFYLALANPVSDCGCFGDAIILTNWQTFWKNVILLSISLFVLANNQRLVRLIHRDTQWLIIAFAIISFVLFMRMNLRRLPFIDYRPWHVGANVEESMTVPDDAPAPRYETYFTLTRDGEQREFTLEDYPDSTWTFVSSRSVLIDPGYQPPITDFALVLEDGTDVTSDIFGPGPAMLLVMNELRAEDMLDILGDLYEYALLNDIPFYALTSSTADDIAHWRDNTGALYPILTLDDITLKTIIRSNPGLVILNDGVITAKWSRHDLPHEGIFEASLDHQPWAVQTADERLHRHVRIIVLLFFPYIFLPILDLLVRRKKYAPQLPTRNRKP